MITSKAIQLPSLKFEIVGFLNAGNIFSTSGNFLKGIFIFKPTIPSAFNAPCKSIARFSIFSLFQESFQEELFAISLVVEVKISSTILK